MELLALLLVVWVVYVFIVLPIQVRSLSNRTDELQAILRDLSSRVDALSAHLRHLSKKYESIGAKVQAVVSPVPPTETAGVPEPSQPSVASASAAAREPAASPSTPAGPPLVSTPPSPSPQLPAPARVAPPTGQPPPGAAAAKPVPSPMPQQRPPLTAASSTTDLPGRRARPAASATPARPTPRLLDWEEALGANWLLKIGMATLVVGIALFLGYTVQRMGPWGKVLVGLGTSGAAIAAGSIIEARKRYEVFGRVLLAGGWGLAYFTAYAMHHIQAAKVVESEGLGLLLLLAAAGGMVIHSLRYRSQFVTGFAYGLAYLTIILYQVQWYTLLASLVLASSMVVVLRQLNWYALESFAIAGTYANHFAWLHPILSPMGADKKPFPEYAASTALLTVYWVIFTVSHFLRRTRDETEERWLQLALILNVLGYLALSGYQSIHPEWRFWFLLVVGLIYFGLAYLGRSLDRRGTYLVASTIGAVLVFLAVPFISSYYKVFEGNWSLLWLAECEIFLISGYRLGEVHFRRLAWLASGVLTAYLLFFQIVPNLPKPAAIGFSWGITFALTSAAFAFNFFYLARRYSDEIRTDDDETSVTAYLYTSWLLALAAAWVLIPRNGLALAWLAFAFILYECFRHVEHVHLSHLAHASVALSILRATFVNYRSVFEQLYSQRGWSLGVVVLLAVTVALYAFAGNARRPPHYKAFLQGLAPPAVFDGYSYAGWALAVATSWLLVPWQWWAVVLAAGVWVLHAAGLCFNDRRFEVQAQITAVWAALRVLITNIPAEGEILGLAQRVVTGGAVAILVYLYGERADRHPVMEDTLFEKPQRWLNAPFATLILALLIWYELSTTAVAIGWGLLALGLVEVGRASGRSDLRWQGHVMAAVAFGRILVANLNAPGFFGPVSIRLMTVAPLAAMFYYLFAELRRDAAFRRLGSLESSTAVVPIYSYFGLISLLAILRFEVSSAWVAAWWAAVAVLLLSLGRVADIEGFRTQGVLVTFLVLARSGLENFYLTGDMGPFSLRSASVGVVAAILLAGFGASKVFPASRPGRRRTVEGGRIRRAVLACDEGAHHFFFFAAAGLVTALIGLETRGGGNLTAAWAVEALVVFLFAVLVGERAYRLLALGLLLICTGKVILLDVWRLETLKRIVAFIVLGAVLLLVSFFYTRHKETWRKIVLDR